MDPRQRGLLGAAWQLGYVAHMTAGGVDAVCLSAPVGEFGVAYARTDYPQPWFDDQDARVYPAYHVLRGMAEAAGRTRLATTLSDASAVQAVAWRGDGEVVVWLANLTAAPQIVTIEAPPGRRGRIARLDQESFVAATADPDALALLASEGELGTIELGAYAVLRLQTRADQTA